MGPICQVFLLPLPPFPFSLETQPLLDMTAAVRSAWPATTRSSRARDAPGLSSHRSWPSRIRHGHRPPRRWQHGVLRGSDNGGVRPAPCLRRRQHASSSPSSVPHRRRTHNARAHTGVWSWRPSRCSPSERSRRIARPRRLWSGSREAVGVDLGRPSSMTDAGNKRGRGEVEPGTSTEPAMAMLAYRRWKRRSGRWKRKNNSPTRGSSKGQNCLFTQPGNKKRKEKKQN